MMPSGQGYELKQGDTEGVDKEWFEGWLEENRALSLVKNGSISWRDTPEPTEDELRAEQEQRDREERDRKRNEEEQQKLVEANNAAAASGSAQPTMGIQDGPGNPERTQPADQHESATMSGDQGDKDKADDPRVKNTDGLTDLTDTDPNANPNAGV